MISKIIAWIIELFRKKPQKQKELEQRIKDDEKKLEEIEDEKMDDDAVNDYLNE